MLNAIEDYRNEFKVKLTDKFEEEVVAFLNAKGGNIFIEQLDNGIHIGHGSLFAPCKCKTNQKIPRTLSTFIFRSVPLY